MDDGFGAETASLRFFSVLIVLYLFVFPVWFLQSWIFYNFLIQVIYTDVHPLLFILDILYL